MNLLPMLIVALMILGGLFAFTLMTERRIATAEKRLVELENDK